MTKYLGRYAEAEAGCGELEQLCRLGPWAHAVVIPARREGVECLEAASAPAGRGSVLCVLVVNAPAGCDASEELLERVEARALRWRGPAGLSLHRVGDLDVLLVDRCREERSFGPEDGVGLARKIGADLVLRLHELGALRWPWIHSTDADARLPAEHFERVAGLDAAAVVAPFWHVPGDDARAHEATLRYELSLRYYVAGLRFAGSGYAFHTIGSLISVSCSAYAGVRGFPRRKAGEDFYLLNKVAKLGPVRSVGGAPVEIRSRRSSRAPFGTGPAVEALLAGEDLRVYDPRVFETLARVLAAHGSIGRGEVDAGLGALAQLCEEFEDIPQLHEALGAARALTDRYRAAQLERRLRESFDAFRTLKLIHGLTAARWPKRSWAAAIERASFLDVGAKLTLDEQRRALRGF
ncbi:hypothetical protein ENSA5_07140 [Enhygromyxa salina]|uniref:Glycosyltransferase 2-like domain-containing protein n=1 Tax=Enhygromyxa salina TaxID=215803 RepID=A0A2S9YH80_9BACT|nr:hypothetical protein ENSA5_07140 [Enhygromyxa salina]